MPTELNTKDLLNSLNELRKALLLHKGAAVRTEDGQDGCEFSVDKIKENTSPLFMPFFFPSVSFFSYLRNDLSRDAQDSKSPDPAILQKIYCRAFEPMDKQWELCADHLRYNYGTSVWVQEYADKHLSKLPDKETVQAKTLDDSIARYQRVLLSFIRNDTVSSFWKENRISPRLEDFLLVMGITDAKSVDMDDLDTDKFDITEVHVKEWDIIIAWILIWLATFPCGFDADLSTAQQHFCEKLVVEIEKRFNDNTSSDPAPGDPDPDDPPYVPELIREQRKIDFTKILDYDILRNLISEMIQSSDFKHNEPLCAYFDILEYNALVQDHAKVRAKAREY